MQDPVAAPVVSRTRPPARPRRWRRAWLRTWRRTRPRIWPQAADRLSSSAAVVHRAPRNQRRSTRIMQNDDRSIGVDAVTFPPHRVVFHIVHSEIVEDVVADVSGVAFRVHGRSVRAGQGPGGRKWRDIFTRDLLTASDFIHIFLDVFRVSAVRGILGACRRRVALSVMRKVPRTLRGRSMLCGRVAWTVWRSCSVTSDFSSRRSRRTRVLCSRRRGWHEAASLISWSPNR